MLRNKKQQGMEGISSKSLADAMASVVLTKCGKHKRDMVTIRFHVDCRSDSKRGASCSLFSKSLFGRLPMSISRSSSL